MIAVRYEQPESTQRTTLGYVEMVKAGRWFPQRVWAVEGCNGIG
jgi:hypothetical protein